MIITLQNLILILIIAKSMSQKFNQIDLQLRELLSYENDFLAQTHKQVYHSNLPLAESILKFQINHISQINDKFNAAIAAIAHELLQKKTAYQAGLRQQFQNILQADYLPLLRINRYEITKLSLFGFDIYVEPLQAFLHILSRMDALKQRIIESGINVEMAENAEGALEKGWDAYSIYAIHWKLSFNIYILKEYLMVGSKSFLRKDRDILFTGINNFYAELVPILKSRGCHKLLLQLGELNNSLYFFHPSFNYFHLYTLLLPVTDQLEPVFAFMKEVADKCLRTNIITPLLFGILRNRPSFLRFIKEVDSPIWLPYLNAIVAGISINLKLRILQYEQILEVFEQAVLKAGLLGTIRTEQILGKLDESWKDAKQFFISAVKIGFNSGDAETWKSVDFQTIGPRIIGNLLNGMLLGLESNLHNIKQYLQNGQEKLDAAVRSISQNKIDLYFIKATICQLQNDLTTQRHLFSLIQICNLIKLLNLSNQYSLNFVVSSFNRIAVTPNRIMKLRLAQASSSINQMIFQLGTQHLTFLKQKIVNFHIKFPPTTNFPQLIDFYFSNFEPKKCLNHLLLLRVDQSQSQAFLLLVFEKFIPKAGNKRIILKTFDQQYITNNNYINLPYQSHCLLNFATVQFTKGNKFAKQIIQNLIRKCPSISFALLNFPIHTERQLFSFSSWLVDHMPYQDFLAQILKETKGCILSESGQDLIKILIYPSILDHISKRINEANQFQQLRCLCSLAIKITAQMEVNHQFAIDLIATLLYLLEKADNSQSVALVVKDIATLSVLVFKQKVKIWLLSLLQKKIEGRTELMIGNRKRILKTNNANIYFLGNIIQSPTTSTIPQKLNLKQLKPNKVSTNFQQELKSLSKINLEQLRQLSDGENAVLLQQIKSFSIPSKSEVLLKELFQQKQPLTIDFLSLNFENHSIIIEQAISSNNQQYLCSQRLHKNVSKLIPRMFELQRTSGCLILQKMSSNLSPEERMAISQSFYLDLAFLSSYCEHQQGIEYLAVFNGSNWRVLMQYFTKEFNSSSLSSIILQYHQFVKITNQKNAQYEKGINKYASLFNSFASLLIYKINSIFSLPYSKEELNLRSANQLSFLNIVASSLQLKEALIKLAALNQTLIQKSISPLIQWISIVRELNSQVNAHYNGEIMLSNFLYGYYLTNETVCEAYKTEIGIYLEKYEETVNHQQLSKQYLPTYFKPLPLKQFIEKVPCWPSVIQNSASSEQVSKEYLDLLKQMQQSQLLKITGNVLTINLTKKLAEEDSKRFYALGCYYARVGHSGTYQLSNLLKLITNRAKLPWELLKQVNLEGYTHIMSVIADTQIAKKNLTFTYGGQALLANAEGMKVNQYNKLQYCNKVGLSLIGEDGLLCLKYFMRGFIYQQSQS